MTAEQRIKMLEEFLLGWVDCEESWDGGECVDRRPKRANDWCSRCIEIAVLRGEMTVRVWPEAAAEATR